MQRRMVRRFGVATPRGRQSQHRSYIFQQNSIAHNYIYSSKTASHVYISAEQHREYIFQQNRIARIYSGRTTLYVRIRILGVATPGSGGPSPVKHVADNGKFGTPLAHPCRSWIAE